MSGPRNLSGLILLLLINSSVFSQIAIEKNENFKNEKLDSSKIIIISPDFSFLQITDGRFENYDIESRFITKMIDIIKKTSAKNYLNIEVVTDPEYNKSGLGYYNDLIPLKNNILKVNSTQNNPFNASKRSYQKLISQNVFVLPVKIFPEFAELEKKYGTPYFGVYGWVSIDATHRKYNSSNVTYNDFYGKSSYLYFIVVNVLTSEVVYREVKKIDLLAREAIFLPIIYETFNYFSNNITGTK